MPTIRFVVRAFVFVVPVYDRLRQRGIMPAEVPDPVENTSTPNIPDKLYFRIGEVSRLTGIKPYVLRFWESEFPGLGPKKSGTGHRLYRRKDVELVFQIKNLLYDKRYTIEGARKILEGRAGPERLPTLELSPEDNAVNQAELFPNAAALNEIRKELSDILQILS